MSSTPNPDSVADPTEVIEPTSPDASPVDDVDTPIEEPGPADPRPDAPPQEEFDTTISPHFL